MDPARLLHDSMSSQPSDIGTKTTRFRPYASPDHQVSRARYITSNDPRGYIPVFEYPLNGQWIMMDADDGYILWTGIWKALGNAKADIVRMLESQPDLAPQLRRVRGGYLKIQGTWMPYEVAIRLARRVAWPIRDDLVPLFGPTFPGTCLAPDQPGYGQVVNSATGRRRARRNVLSSSIAPSKPLASASRPATTQPQQQEQGPSALFMLSQVAEAPPRQDQQRSQFTPTLSHAASPTLSHDYRFSELAQRAQPSPLTIPAFPQSPYQHHASTSGMPSVSAAAYPLGSNPQSRTARGRERSGSLSRYTPYGPALRASSMRSSFAELPPLPLPGTQQSPTSRPWRARQRSSTTSTYEPISLPPIQAIAPESSRSYYSSGGRALGTAHTLPPISSLCEQDAAISMNDSAAVLRRLTLDDETLGLAQNRRRTVHEDEEHEAEPVKPTEEQLWTRRRSLSAPPLHQEYGGKKSSAALHMDSALSRHRLEPPSSSSSQRHNVFDQHYTMRNHDFHSSFSTHDETPVSDTSPITPSTPASGSASDSRTQDGSPVDARPRSPGYGVFGAAQWGRRTPRQHTSTEASTATNPWPMPPHPMSRRQQESLEAYRFGAPTTSPPSPSNHFSGADDLEMK